MAEEFINIKNGPVRALSHVIGHAASGKGGRMSAANVFFPEDFGAVRYATRTAAISGTDSTAAFNSLFDAWYAAGGGTIFLNGWFRVSECFQLANGNTETTIGTQPPLMLNGIGGQGTYARPEGGAGIIWTAEAGTPPAKFTTLGRGLLILDNCVFASRQSSGNVKPFIHTTNTTIKTGGGFAFDGAVYGANAAEDGFILGGQTAHEADSGFDRRSADCGFQGYGTVIDRVYCNGIRRLAVLQRYANAIRITRNTLWNTCGNNSDTGGAIEIDGAPISPASFATGTVIGDNLIEVNYYKYGIYLKNAAHSFLYGNDVYDATAMTIAAAFVDPSCQTIRVIPSLAPAGKPYLGDASARALVWGAENGQYDIANSLKAGKSGYPNLFGSTKFSGGSASGNTVLQPETVPANDGAMLLEVLRSAADPTNPGQRQFSVNYGGGLSVNGENAGNFANGQASGASWSNNGRQWNANGTGANMGQRSGSGGSYFDAWNFGYRFFDQAGNYQCRIGAGLAGLKWGTSSTADDLGISRNAAGVLEVNSGTSGALRDVKVRQAVQSPQASVTPTINGELVVEATSNTTLTFKLKGSDGTVRSGTLTLA